MVALKNHQRCLYELCNVGETLESIVQQTIREPFSEEIPLVSKCIIPA
jgi:hypothetical protein